MKKLLIIILFLFISQSSLIADIPHFLNFKLILNQSDAGKKAQTSLKNKLENGIKDLKNKEKQILEEEKKLIQQKKIISSDEYKKKISSLRKKVTSLQKERNTLLQTVAKQRSKAKNELLKNLNPIVKDYMSEKNIKMVLDKKVVLLADDKLDITNDIMAILNKKLKSINLN
tara:strand:+ start:1445 stop:1960 length:516 start_codon:yes stop_codon:yes gene_type:complete